MANKNEDTVQCNDKKCPIHGNVSIRGYKFKATVVSSKMKNSAVVERPFVKKVPKFERFEKRKTRLSAHNPECINAKKGDIVYVQACRPLSKTKSFTIIEKVD